MNTSATDELTETDAMIGAPASSTRASLRAIALAFWVALAAPADADMVIDWNEQLVAVVQAEKANALVQSRAAAIVHTAMFEAVNAI